MDLSEDTKHRLRNHKLSTGKKKYFDSLEKENIEQENNKLPSIEVKRNVTFGPYLNDNNCTRGKKNLDNGFDRPLKPKGLQEIDKSNNYGVIARRRNHSTSDTSGSKTFVKSRFTVYNDERSSKENDSVAGVADYKALGFEKSAKSSGLRESVKNNALPLRKQENDGKSSGRSSSSSNKPVTSPKNMPQISNANVFKIKEYHKKASIAKKTRVIYDILSLELAYNIDYMSEYVRFQMEINERKKLSKTFLTTCITADQRRLIVKYLINSTTYYKYPSFILYQAVKIFDSYIDAVDVNVNELQNAALAALWIALKKDLITDEIPEASMIVELAGSTFQNNKKTLIETEKKILMSLNFEISFPEPFSMLALYTVMIQEVRELKSSKIQDLYYCGSYLIDLSLLHDKLFHISAVHLAAISAEIALVLIMTSDDNLKNPQWNHWRNRVLASNPTLEKYSLSDSQMNEIRNQLLQKVMLSKEVKTDYFVVYKKYNYQRYGPVAKFIVSKVASLFLQRIADPNYSAYPILF